MFQSHGIGLKFEGITSVKNIPYEDAKTWVWRMKMKIGFEISLFFFPTAFDSSIGLVPAMAKADMTWPSLRFWTLDSTIHGSIFIINLFMVILYIYDTLNMDVL